MEGLSSILELIEWELFESLKVLDIQKTDLSDSFAELI
jgi:hypothetical protein